MTDDSLHLLRGTVDLLILKGLSWGPCHGYAVSEWLGKVTDGTLLLEEGTLYPALHRLENKGVIEAEWGLSANNRRAKYYRLTDVGRRRLTGETQAWTRYAEAIAKALGAKAPA
ncbi:MAG: PadR family transcriptional regulator [Gemmatimonadetes bacterium]|nr:PadR family transcriptional regulator [Gemmatimonadota bacterium]NNM34193.1 PadR family transcriptional regulator [Gemmatimonadota bacterium]